MSLRGSLRSTRCYASIRQVLSKPGLSFARNISQQDLAISHAIRNALARKAAKATSTVSTNSLPQGARSPLPPFQGPEEADKSYSRVLQQHLDNVRKYRDCVVLTRIGDFYEMYFDQVEQYAHLVGLKKAKRATALGPVSMAGFQFHQLDRYLKMFVQDHGLQVAISEQVRLPESQVSTKGNTLRFDRKVTRIITAGTLIDESFADSLENNFILGIHADCPASDRLSPDMAKEQYVRATKVGISWLDLSSGEFYTQSSDLASLPSLVTRVAPREVVLDASFERLDPTLLQKMTGDGGYVVHFQSTDSLATSVVDWTDMLEAPVPEDEQSAFTSQEVSAGNLLLAYIRDRLIDTHVSLQLPIRRSAFEYMAVDKHSLRGLEISTTMRDNRQHGTLLYTIRRTVTNSGARLLLQRLKSPSLSLSVINSRLDLVQELLYQEALREHVRAVLRKTSDTLRLLQRFTINKGDADDMLSLAGTITQMQQISNVLHDHIVANQDRELGELPEEPLKAPLTELTCLWDVLGRFDLIGPLKVAKAIQSTIDEVSLSQQHAVEDEQALASEEMADEVIAADASDLKPPSLARRAAKAASRASSSDSSQGEQDIWTIRKTASPVLRAAHEDLEDKLSLKSGLAKRLRLETGYVNLTLKWSASLGHYCHVKTKDPKKVAAKLEGTQSIGSTKSTSTFYFIHWTNLGARIDLAKARIRDEETRVFNKLRGQILENLMRLRRNAAILDELDVACSSATIAKERDFVRPILNTSTTHNIINGRHPTVDVGLRAQGNQFTANNCSVGSPNQSIYLITGPNMAGKSTYLRQNVLITILAQTGSFVPADYAELGLVDKVFSRVGSGDNLYQNQSTFMVEMLEAAEILKQATPRSFVIMDEVGRGTTPEDGVAVGYACLHHLHNVNKCRTLFATHFHDLVGMAEILERVACWHSDIKEEAGGEWAYAYKLKKGVNSNSHALKVARMAGMPEEAVGVAAEVLRGYQAAHRRGRQHGGLTHDGVAESTAISAAA
jgi:DNA mismatch repair ATPase MutS